jgi:hypothetical protein
VRRFITALQTKIGTVPDEIASMTALRFVLCLCLAAVVRPLGAAPPSFARDVKPFLVRYCSECHSGRDCDGELNLETYANLMKGGTHGPAVIPGQPDKSPLVRNVEGKGGPKMPPKNAKLFPKSEEYAVLRAWVQAGARDDSGIAAAVVLPEIRPQKVLPPPVAALAYRPDGKLLAAGGQREVVLIDPDKGDVVGVLAGQAGEVTALAFSPDGRTLAVAAGESGRPGEVRLYRAVPGAVPAGQPAQTFAAHQDRVHDLAFSPDGALLATCGYDRLVKLWDLAGGKPPRELKDHSDAVYGVAFSPDGKLLASVAADRAVKVWDVASGKRLYTLGEATDWVYAVAWSPDGRFLAAGGVDRSVRVWAVNAAGGRVVHSVFAHEGAVLRLAYAADGQTLYTLSEDRAVKAWDAARMIERRVYDRQPEAPLSLAVRPDHRQLAVGRYDGALVLLDEASGKVVAEPLPIKPKPPVLNRLSPPAAVRGQAVRLKLEGQNLRGAEAIVSNLPGVKTEILPGDDPAVLEVAVTIPAPTPAGAYTFAVRNAAGQSAALPLIVDPFAPVAKEDGHGSPRTGQVVTLPATLVGSIGRAGMVDFYRFEAKAGQEIGVQAVTAAIGSKLEPVLQFTDADGRVLAESSNGLLGVVCPTAGIYAVGIRDRDYRGEAALTYRLHVGDLPVITGVFPLGVRRGAEAKLQIEGVNLGPNRSVTLPVPADAAVGARLPVPFTAPGGVPLGGASVLVGDLAEVLAGAPGQALPVPATANGHIDKPGAADVWRFSAKKGQRLIVEVNARRLGSPLDSLIEILDAEGKPLPRATLRCLARTYTVFRDHDAAGPGIRIESWSELAIDDYLLVGEELVRIRELPRNPDDDCQFYSLKGQRLGFLGTTPTFHAQGQPMYKVAIHPPGMSFPPNGLPVVTLFWRNDDGGPGLGKDSRLVFDPPADGDYQVRLTDARGLGGPSFAYRLTARPPSPDFRVSFNPAAPVLSRGGGISVTVNADRIDEFDGPIAVRLEGLPKGVSAPPTTIPAGENSTAFALFAEPDAVIPANLPPLKLVARAVIDGREVVREGAGGPVKLIDPGDIVTATEQSEVVLRPGGEVRVTVTVERRNGFTGRIPVEVRGLPHGVRVLDIGLNGILITEKEARRTFVIYAEPWVQPTEHPFVVLAKREGKNSEHAARSVLLKVVAK